MVQPGIHLLPGKSLFADFFFRTEPVFGSFFPYGYSLLSGGRILAVATRIFSTSC